MKKSQDVRVKHTKSQRVWGVLALVALFGCGVMVGLDFGRLNSQPKMPQGGTVTFSPNANQKATCVVIEELLAQRLYPEESQSVHEHEENIKIYEKLVMNGCSENQMKYHTMAMREREIVAALQQSGTEQQTCEQIESLLLEQLPYADGDADARIDRAKIYANLSERGCAENSAKYVEMAKQELEIARALEDDEFDNQETIEVVETYKRLNMQAAAEEIFETAKKLTNPAIDFILEVEKIINEQ